MDECLGEVFQTDGRRASVTNDLSSVFVLCFGFVCVCGWVGGWVGVRMREYARVRGCVCDCTCVYTRGDDGRIGYV